MRKTVQNDTLREVGSKVRSLVRSVKLRFTLPAVRYQGFLLPPAYMRYCGSTFKDDHVFLESGRQEARRLVEENGLAPALLEFVRGRWQQQFGLVEVG